MKAILTFWVKFILTLTKKDIWGGKEVFSFVCDTEQWGKFENIIL